MLELSTKLINKFYLVSFRLVCDVDVVSSATPRFEPFGIFL